MAQKSTYEELEERVKEYEKEISRFRVVDEKRRYSSKEWRSIFDAISDAVCMIDPDGTITRCNKAMTDLLGKPFEAVIGAPCWEIVHGTSEPIEGCPLVRMRETRQRESKVLQMDGGYFNVAVDPLLDEKGNIISAVHIISNITERKQVEEALLKSEKLHRTILFTAMDGFLMTDPQGSIKEVNDAYCRMSGYSDQEMLTMNISDLESAMKPANVAAKFRYLRKHGEGRFESQHRRKDGSIFEVEISVKYRPEEGERMVAFLRDITDRKRAEEQLKLLTTAMSQSAEGIALADLDGTLTYLNNAFATMHGYNPEELIGKHVSIFHTSEQMPSVEASLQQLKGHGEFNGELWRVTKDGTVFPSLMNNSLVFDEAGQPITMIGTLRDITELKQAEEALRKSEKRFRDLSNSSPAAISILRGEKYLYVNPSWEDLTGYTKEEAQTLNPFSVAHPDMRELVRTRAEDRIKGKPVPMRYEIKGISKKGDIIWHDFAATVIDYDNEPAILCVSADMTDRKRAEEDREKLINELQAALDNIKTLKGLLPICAECKKIRDDKGYWNQIEGYIEKHSDALFSHALCPECMDKIYGGEDWYNKKDFEK